MSIIGPRSSSVYNSRTIRLKRPKPTYRPAALDWPVSDIIDGDRWTLIPSRPEHASFAEALLDVVPSLVEEPGTPLSADELSDLEVDELLAEEADDAPLPRVQPRDYEEQELSEMRIRHGVVCD